MAIYSLSPIFEPQYVAGAAAALVFATPGGPTVIPAGYNYQISVARVANKTGAPVSFKCWRVPSGSTDDDAHIVVPAINIPVATSTSPYFDITALWGVVLQPGDAIWALAGAASSLILQGDGAVIQI